MSNVASLENCKELFEISGWDDMPGATSYEWYKPLDDIKEWILKPKQHFSSSQAKELHYEKCLYPAYDSGFLLRKLQVKGATVSLGYGDWHYPSKQQSWKANFSASWDAEADTPENALCKLAIELFKQGILK